MESLNNSLKIILEQIADCICSRVNNPLPDHIGGLYAGVWGKLLFLCYYAQYTKNPKILETAEDYVNKLLSHASLEKLSHTYCSGYAGILYLFQIIRHGMKCFYYKP